MPYKYIGRTTDFKGKTLWEILGNLKNFGIGRIVARNMFRRYPEPSYMKVLKVAALPNETDPLCYRKIIVLVEKTFRGKTYDKYVQIDSTSYKTDYILIPKDQEAAFCGKTTEQVHERILPSTMEYPPLLKKLVMRYMKNTGEQDLKEPKMLIKYNLKGNKTYRVANEGETPTVEVTPALGKPASPSLYANIQQ